MCNSVAAEETRPKREQSESQFIMETINLSHQSRVVGQVLSATSENTQGC